MSGRDRAALATKKPKQQAKTPQATNTLTTETLSPVEAMMLPMAQEISRLKASTASPNQILNLQRQLGNRAVIGLLARKYETRTPGKRRKFIIRRQPTDDNERLTPDTRSAEAQQHESLVKLHKSGDAPIARKHLVNLEMEAWTGRTGKPEKKALYEAIQQRIDMYNSTPPGKTPKDLSFDLMHLQFLETDITKWIGDYGASEARGSKVNSLLTAVQAEASMVAGKLAVVPRQPAREEAPVAVAEGGGGGESKAGGPPPPMAPRPSSERVRELRDVVSPPSPVPKSGDVAPTPPPSPSRERRGPPPLPSAVPTGVTPTPV